MKYTTKDITAVTYNWMQQRLTLGAIVNFRRFYPDIPLIVMDAGNTDVEMESFNKIYSPTDKSLTLDKDMAKLRKRQKELNYKLIEIGENLSHGSLTDYAVWEAKTPLLLTMDNDVRLRKDGIIEEYLEKMNSDEELYAVGPTAYQGNSLNENWVGLGFSLFKLAPIKKYHLTFGSYVIYTAEEKPIYLETGGFVHHALKDKYPHRTITANYKSHLYPYVDYMRDKFFHLKVREGNEEQKKEWLENVDG